MAECYSGRAYDSDCWGLGFEVGRLSFYVVLQPPWSWSIKDLNLDILKIEAARWKDTVSKCKCKCKDAKSAQFRELIILELHLGETLNLSEKKFEKNC